MLHDFKVAFKWLCVLVLVVTSASSWLFHVLSASLSRLIHARFRQPPAISTEAGGNSQVDHDVWNAFARYVGGTVS